MLVNVYIRKQRSDLAAFNIGSRPTFFIDIPPMLYSSIKREQVDGELEIYPVGEDPHFRNLSNSWINGGVTAPEIKIVEKIVELPPKIIEKIVEVEVIKEVIKEVEVVKEVKVNSGTIVELEGPSVEATYEDDEEDFSMKEIKVEGTDDVFFNEDGTEASDTVDIVEDVVEEDEDFSMKEVIVEGVTDVFHTVEEEVPVEEVVEETVEEAPVEEVVEDTPVEEAKEEAKKEPEVIEDLPEEDVLIIDTEKHFNDWQDKNKKELEPYVEEADEAVEEVKEVVETKKKGNRNTNRKRVAPVKEEEFLDEVVVELTPEEEAMFAETEEEEKSEE